MRSKALSAAVVSIGLTGCGAPPMQEAAPTRCEELAALTVADTTVTLVERVAAGAFRAPEPEPYGPPPDFSQLPAFCRVTGSIRPSPRSDIRFELWLPDESWNGKFLQTGNGGAAGSIVYGSLVDPLSRGYAVAHTDTGHRGAGGDFSWAVGQPERLTDYQYRAVHELTRVGKAITETRYGRAPERSYWNGCSTGGRQGLKEAQRFPEDYDGIIAGAPASNWSPLMSLSILIQNNVGPGGLGVDKLRLLEEASLAACDATDGVTDRVIADPGSCGFDPVSLQCGEGEADACLSPTEIAAARRIYAGVRNEAGDVLFPGTGPGSEGEWAFYASPDFRIGTSYFRNVVANDPDWDPATLDVDKDLDRAERQDGGAADAMDPDLSAFIARGGKLLAYHGTTDGLIPYGNSVRYHESVVERLGNVTVEDSVKLYLVAGMDHCYGGEGAYEVDWLAALEAWVEDGKEPSALPAAHPAAEPGSPRFTRPVCPYPQTATYSGSGDPGDAANFECVEP